MLYQPVVIISGTNSSSSIFIVPILLLHKYYRGIHYNREITITIIISWIIFIIRNIITVRKMNGKNYVNGRI